MPSRIIKKNINPVVINSNKYSDWLHAKIDNIDIGIMEALDGKLSPSAMAKARLSAKELTAELAKLGFGRAQKLAKTIEDTFQNRESAVTNVGKLVVQAIDLRAEIPRAICFK